MKKAGVLGCGVIGSSWVRAFLAGGYSVAIWDPSTSATALLAERYPDGVTAAESPDAAAEGASFIQESGPERLDRKRELLFRIAEAVGERTVVASSSSTLQPSDLQHDLPFADRLVIGHPFNPPHIIPLVEVVGGKQTAGWALDAAMACYAALGKHPIRLQCERPGHLANRLQAAVWREAIDAVACGQASVADVDAIMTLALGPRWALMGPFATFDLGGGQGGLAHFLDHLGKPFEALWDDAHRPVVSEQLKRSLVEAVDRSSSGRTPAELATERDVRLYAVLEAARRPLGELRTAPERCAKQ